MKISKLFIFGLLTSVSSLCFSMDYQGVSSKKSIDESTQVDELNFSSADKQEDDSDSQKVSSPVDALLEGEFDAFPETLSVCMRKGEIDSNIIHSVLMTEYLDNFYSRKDVMQFTLSFIKAFYSQDILKKLVNNKCNVHYNSGFSEEIAPLSLALNKGCLDIAKLLLKAGADIDQADSKGRYPMGKLIDDEYIKPEDIVLKKRVLEIMASKLKDLPSEKKLDILNQKN